LVALLIVEALLVQLALIMYEFLLVWRSESLRVTNLVVLVGLPGPILRALAGKVVRVSRSGCSSRLLCNDSQQAAAQ
jgi:hypothetical protein